MVIINKYNKKKERSPERSFYNIVMLKRKEVLTTKSLILKPIENGDKKDVLAVFENKLVGKTYMTPVFDSDEAREKFFARIKEVSQKDEIFCYGIYLNKSFIGLLNDTSVENDEIELGYCLHPDYWNKGYATETLEAAIKELFRMGYKNVMAAHFIENPASGRVMQKCGMTKIEKTEVIEYQGTKHPCIYYAITNK